MRDDWWSNCLLYALRRVVCEGGYLVIRRSRVEKSGHWRAWWPHFLWSPDLGTFYQFKPLADLSKVWFPPPLFRGYVYVSTHGEK